MGNEERKNEPAGVYRRGRMMLFVLVQLMLAGLVVEIGLRLARPHHRGVQTVLYQNVARTGYGDAQTLPELLESSPLGFQPYATHSGFVLNSRGLRAREYTSVKTPGTLRVVALGDSFTFASGGLPAAQHWPQVLERRLAARRGTPVEVLRLGVPGTGPRFQLRLWQLEAARLTPDVVVLGFFVGNDFLDASQDLAAGPGEESWAERLASRSYTARAIRNLWRLHGVEEGTPVINVESAGGQGITRGGFEVEGYAERFDDERPSFTEEAYLDLEARRLALCHRGDAERFERRLARVAEILTAFRDEVESTGAYFLVLVIPDEFQVDPELFAGVLTHLGKRREDYDLNLPQRRLAELFAARGIATLDVLPAFREHAAVERLYRPRDSHWNAAGNRLAAELLAIEIARRWPKTIHSGSTSEERGQS